ncbi:MAG: riboflavin biosynthesis protein RibF [Pirellulales bacterium]|nr:riboflavin biosynthesis protein RibF [Pirellulales bacterium]
MLVAHTPLPPPNFFGQGGCALAIGNFDGVHGGHAVLLEQLVQLANLQQLPAVVLTFEPHPLALLKPELAPIPLTTLNRKIELLAARGIAGVWAYPTTPDFLNLSAADFFQRLVVEQLAARVLVEGPNFYFGKDRFGDVRLLGQLCAAANIELCVVPPQAVAGELISSTVVRNLLSRGDVAAARRLLTAPYQISGQVTLGAQRGTGLGFPTANLTRIATLIPAAGVYAGLAKIGPQTLAAAIHIGPNPTFGETRPKFEVHVLDWSGNLYDQELTVTFLCQLRGVRTFANVTELRQQLQVDIARTREAAATELRG